MSGVMTVYLAGGCFWGLEKYLSLVKGVVSTEVGYANGRTKNPTYEDVCCRDTGHAETVKVVYDPGKISLYELLDVYFDAIDPTSVNRQGNDVGEQYRTGIYYVNEDDKEVVEKAVANLAKRMREPVAIEVVPLINFYAAEEYHQKYLDKNPFGYCQIGREKFQKAREFNPEKSRG
jgi:methionine-S-sulfoxide reductase